MGSWRAGLARNVGALLSTSIPQTSQLSRTHLVHVPKPRVLLAKCCEAHQISPFIAWIAAGVYHMLWCSCAYKLRQAAGCTVRPASAAHAWGVCMGSPFSALPCGLAMSKYWVSRL